MKHNSDASKDFLKEVLGDSKEEESVVKQEHVVRILKNPEDEAPLVAKELYPNDEKAQEIFVEFVENFVDILTSRNYGKGI